ncbi:MAG TPA: hypothetical protein VFX93_05300, partial [Xanthomonadaceae bacterium]|nr:hypothetical protein [Xanthomonadaceae bacterium]
GAAAVGVPGMLAGQRARNYQVLSLLTRRGWSKSKGGVTGWVAGAACGRRFNGREPTSATKKYQGRFMMRSAAEDVWDICCLRKGKMRQG